jgi:hypothetical protein
MRAGAAPDRDYPLEIKNDRPHIPSEPDRPSIRIRIIHTTTRQVMTVALEDTAVSETPWPAVPARPRSIRPATAALFRPPGNATPDRDIPFGG